MNSLFSARSFKHFPRATLNPHVSMQALFLAFLLAAASAPPAQTRIKAPTVTRFSKRIDTLLQRSPSVQRGDLGYQFVDVLTGEVLAQYNSHRFFTPASNAKLYTTALALNRLGPGYTFQTDLRTTGPWAPGQTTLQDLQLVGGGDPNLSGRTIPYRVDAPVGDPLAVLRDLAGQLFAKGVREINGDVTGVSTRYPDERYPDGWTLDDAIYGYGAPVSALAVNDNIVSLKVTPGEDGQLARVELQPETGNFIILNEVTTEDSRKCEIQVTRPPGSNELVLRGTIGRFSPAWEQDVAVEDPALFAAESLIQVLRDTGITVRGVARSEYRSTTELSPDTACAAPPFRSSEPEAAIASHRSAPLAQIIQVVNKVSQNLHAEMLLREVARMTQGDGSLACGMKEREKFLSEIGITKDGSGFFFSDGSGLARQDLTTPDSTVSLLRSLWASPNRIVWLDSLPIGGVDGSLEHRFLHIRHASRIHAKTGSLSHVNALSGYIETSRHRWIAFSIMVNATPNHSQEVQTFLDKLSAIFLND
jgi:D-alanyl-D-alanine carboxypeptidase/D-alanyl-D-alanine-endopeptidase (penicillin-binding protein 4)